MLFSGTYSIYPGGTSMLIHITLMFPVVNSSEKAYIITICNSYTRIFSISLNYQATHTQRNSPRNFLKILLGIMGVLCLTACNPYQSPNFEERKLDFNPSPDITQRLSNSDTVLKRLYSSGASLHVQFDSLFSWTDYLSFEHKKLGLIYANEAYQLAAKEGYRFPQAIAMYYRADLKGSGKIFGEGVKDALTDAIIAEKLIKPSDDPLWQSNIFRMLGYLYSRLSSNQKSVDSSRMYIHRAFEALEGADLAPQELAYRKGRLYKDLANTYRGVDSLKFLANYQKSLEEARNSKNNGLQAIVWRGLGLFYLGKKNYEHADSVLKVSEHFSFASEVPRILVYTYQVLADLKGRQYDDTEEEVYFQESMEYLNKCFNYQQENLFYTYSTTAYNYLDRFLTLRGTPPKSYGPEADSAILYFKYALGEVQKEGALDLMSFLVNDINDLCNKKASLNAGDCYSLLDSQFYNTFLNENYAAIVRTMQEEIEGSNQRLRNFEQTLLKSSNERRLTTTWQLSGGGLLFAGLIFLVLYQQQQKKRLQARMEALRAQINPHFISNSLNAIENLINSNQREAASKYLIHFSRLSRKILNGSRGPMTSLEDELEMLQHYLALERLRFRDKLTYTIELDPDLNPKLIEVPALILQPYVENAIIHGIKPKSEPGKIDILIQKKGKYLECIIEDDGIGRAKSAQLKAQSVLPKAHTSQGMKITEERLKMAGNLSGQKVQIEDLTDKKGEATGTRVRVLLPFKSRK